MQQATIPATPPAHPPASPEQQWFSRAPHTATQSALTPQPTPPNTDILDERTSQASAAAHPISAPTPPASDPAPPPLLLAPSRTTKAPQKRPQPEPAMPQQPPRQQFYASALSCSKSHEIQPT